MAVFAYFPHQIADKIVNMVATYATKAALSVVESTGTICTALSRFPENIEQLTSTREFQATVPEKVCPRGCPYDRAHGCVCVACPWVLSFVCVWL